MKFAIIGTSWITDKFISAALTIENVELTAVYSRTQEKAKEFADKYNVKLYFSDINEFSKCDKFDAVYIASPNALHYEQSKLMLLNGKNVICEKPATTTEAQMKELYLLAENNNLIYCEAIMTIHTEGFKILKNNLSALGNVRSAHFDFYQLSSKYNLYTDGKNPNIFNPEMHTGCLMDIGVYNIYLACGLFGKPSAIISDAVKLPNGCDAAGTAILKYPGLSVTLNYSKVGQTYSYSEIIGDTGTIMFDSVSQLTDMTFKHKDYSKILAEKNISRDEIMSGEVRFFKQMTESVNFNADEYIFAKNTALTVRAVCDIIRAQNDFLF